MSDKITYQDLVDAVAYLEESLVSIPLPYLSIRINSVFYPFKFHILDCSVVSSAVYEEQR